MKNLQKFFVSLPRNEADGITTHSIDDTFAFLGKG